MKKTVFAVLLVAALAASAAAADLKALVSASKTAQKTDQILLVVDHSMTFWEKGESGEWAKTMDRECGYGKKGLIDAAKKREGDVKTPTGAFPILHAFGRHPNPGTAMTWKAVTPNSYWADDVKVPATYNTWVESETKIGGEHLIDYYQYDYAMAVGYNVNPQVPGLGSAIFVHVKATDHWTTGGCVSLEEDAMIELLKKAHDGAWIIIVKKAADVAKY
ncbi:MAG: L,D-transpeptidase family protein [Pyramidobacter sp.]|nr:L,D-transpeptidase family protein [Pyramidobacter sp.]